MFRDDDRHAALGPVPADGPHRAREGPRAQEVRRRRDRARTPTTQIAEIDAQYAARAAARRRAALVGGRRRGRRGRPDGEGPAAPSPTWSAGTSGMGMGLYGVKPLRLGYAEPRADPAVLPPRRAQRPRRHAARALGPRVRAPVRQPDHLRLRPHARDVAHPPLHRLDGRRRVAVEARLRVPPFNYVGDTHWLRGPRDAQVPRRRRPARRSTSSSRSRTSGARSRRPGHATILLPSREHGPVRLPDPPGGAHRSAGARSTRSPRSSRRR